MRRYCIFLLSLFIIVPSVAFAADFDSLVTQFNAAFIAMTEAVDALKSFITENASIEKGINLALQGHLDDDAMFDAIERAREFGEKNNVLTANDFSYLSKDELMLEELLGGKERPDTFRLKSAIKIKDARLKIDKLIPQLQSALEGGVMDRRGFIKRSVALLAIKQQLSLFDKGIATILPEIFPKGIDVLALIAETNALTDEMQSPLRVKPADATNADRRVLQENLFGSEKKPASLIPLCDPGKPNEPIFLETVPFDPRVEEAKKALDARYKDFKDFFKDNLLDWDPKKIDTILDDATRRNVPGKKAYPWGFEEHNGLEGLFEALKKTGNSSKISPIENEWGAALKAYEKASDPRVVSQRIIIAGSDGPISQESAAVAKAKWEECKKALQEYDRQIKAGLIKPGDAPLSTVEALPCSTAPKLLPFNPKKSLPQRDLPRINQFLVESGRPSTTLLTKEEYQKVLANWNKSVREANKLKQVGFSRVKFTLKGALGTSFQLLGYLPLPSEMIDTFFGTTDEDYIDYFKQKVSYGEDRVVSINVQIVDLEQKRDAINLLPQKPKSGVSMKGDNIRQRQAEIKKLNDQINALYDERSQWQDAIGWYDAKWDKAFENQKNKYPALSPAS